MNKQIKILFGIGVLLMILLAPAPASAISAGGVGIVPAHPKPELPGGQGWFVYEVDPGTVIEDEARIVSTKSEPTDVLIEGLDAFMTEQGAFALAGQESDNNDLGTWIELEKKSLTIQGGESQLVKFKITVPKDAEVGDHMGALSVFKDTTVPDATLRSGGASVSITTRVGVRIYLTVKGDIIRNLRLKSRSLFGRGTKMVFRFNFQNKGNVRADLVTDVKIYGVFGVYDKAEKWSIGQIFPHKNLTQEIAWPGKNRPLFGPFLAKLNEIKPPYSLSGVTTLYVPDARGARRDLRVPNFFAFVGQPLAKFFRRRPKFSTIIVEKGDTKKTVEQFVGLTWAQILAYNKLPSTTRVKVGMELKVPRRHWRKRFR